MNHWRKPLYTIETEFGTLHAVSEEDAFAATECFTRDPVVKFTVRQDPAPYLQWWHFPSVVLGATVILLGLRYLL